MFGINKTALARCQSGARVLIFLRHLLALMVESTSANVLGGIEIVVFP